MSKKQPSDQALRDAFVHQLDRNYSVIAPAGVGKTKAIVDRVIAIALGNPAQAEQWLPRLVVVTYTIKAAEEMHQRARNALIEGKANLATLGYFNRAFFGTIHSFCVNLLKNHGHLLGLPGRFDLVEDDDELWKEFVRNLDQLVAAPHRALLETLLRYQPADETLRLARKIKRQHLESTPPLPPDFPKQDFNVIFLQQGKGSAARTIEASKQALREWLDLVRAKAEFAPLPESRSNAREFKALWDDKFAPLRGWLAAANWVVAAELARAYRAFRIARGQFTYDDQLDLAAELVGDPMAAGLLRREEFRIILDEAQDTDPVQFNILLELARPRAARGSWMMEGGDPPAPGRFCMVGDPQQSIYGNRADLQHYSAVRRRLVDAGAAEEINFAVTFRCDRAIIDSVNALCRPMLHGRDGQAEFYPLQPRPGAGPGQVVRWESPAPENLDDASTDQIARAEAQWLAAEIKRHGHAGLGASGWSEVAILCPRTRWLKTMEAALQQEGLLPQVHSDRAIVGDDPVYAWVTSLLSVMADPEDGFELAGVLREIYGVPDEELAHFTQGDGEALQLVRKPYGQGVVQDVLHQLIDLCLQVQPLPLRDAVAAIFTQTALQERLSHLPGLAAGAQATLEGLLARAAVAEAEGLSLAEFADLLVEGFASGLPAKPVAKECIQLLTCHKSKGLQWEAVILPFLFKKIETVPDYPLILDSKAGAQPAVINDRKELEPMLEKVDRRRRQELQRLLYVSLTRAKKTMVLVDDNKCHKRKKPNESFADLLGLMADDGTTLLNKAWHDLEPDLGKPEKTEPAPALAAPAASLPAWKGIDPGKAAAHSSRAFRRVLPYQLAEEQDDRPIHRIEPTEAGEAARLYGIWWHGMVEDMPWQQDEASLTRCFEHHVAECPDQPRGQREWKALLGTEFFRLLRDSSYKLHPEMPFLWRRNDNECVDGIIDLAILDPAKREWLVADWKTNLVAADEASSLRDLYAPQLQQYAAALQAITGLPARTGIYSTATALWLPMA